MLSTIAVSVGLASGLTHGVTPMGLARQRFAPQRILMQEKAPAPAAVEASAAPPAPPPPAEYSKALPFLVTRKALKGYVGDVGFDPLGFTEILPIVRRRPRRADARSLKSRLRCAVPHAGRARHIRANASPCCPLQDWLREAELKHCRVAMLATVRCGGGGVLRRCGRAR